MKLYVQFMIIVLLAFIGEGISTYFQLPIPGSILGLILLFLALEFKLLRLRHVNAVGNFLLANMTILFLPADVGIMDRYEVIAPFLGPIVLIIVGAIVLNIVVIALVVNYVKNRYEGNYEDRFVDDFTEEVN